MSYTYDSGRPRGNVVAIPTIWLGLALSLLIHILVIWLWLPQIRALMQNKPDEAEATSQLSVSLAPLPPSPPAPPPSPAPRAEPTPPQVQLPKAPPRARPLPPSVAALPPATVAPQAPVAPVVPSAPAPPAPAPVEGDLAAYIAARRRARGEAEPTASPVEDENARVQRNIAANLPSQQTGRLSRDPRQGGGIFQLKHVGYQDAEFEFYGWSNEIGRRATQLFEVRKGDNSDIRLAVIRKMIAIIREEKHEDFIWESQRLGRNVTLSARVADNAGLEEFLMHEFFDDPRRVP